MPTNADRCRPMSTDAGRCDGGRWRDDRSYIDSRERWLSPVRPFVRYQYTLHSTHYILHNKKAGFINLTVAPWGHYYKEKGRRGVKKKRNAPKERSVEISFAYSNVQGGSVRRFSLVKKNDTAALCIVNTAYVTGRTQWRNDKSKSVLYTVSRMGGRCRNPLPPLSAGGAYVKMNTAYVKITSSGAQPVNIFWGRSVLPGYIALSNAPSFMVRLFAVMRYFQPF